MKHRKARKHRRCVRVLAIEVVPETLRATKSENGECHEYQRPDAEIAANLQIGPTDQGMVRIYVEAEGGID